MRLIEVDALKETLDKIPARSIENADGRAYVLIRLSTVFEIIKRLPSAYPETDGFCTDCKEYDSERHFCPRFDRVIKTTIEEMGIIHCKDCKHGELFSDQYLCRKDVFWREGDFYCGYAERREDG